MIIETLETPFDLSYVKRLYLPFKVTGRCACGKDVVVDLSGPDSDYLHHPAVGGVSWVYFYCPACEREWDESVRLLVALVPEEVPT